jgi:hypothetical protein
VSDTHNSADKKRAEISVHGVVPLTKSVLQSNRGDGHFFYGQGFCG